MLQPHIGLDHLDEQLLIFPDADIPRTQLNRLFIDKFRRLI